MRLSRLALGLDLSTQSLSAVVLDIDRVKVVYTHALNYLSDTRLNHFGLTQDYILPPSEPGQALQPPLLFLAALDALFSDLKQADVALDQLAVINVSAQQHGHVYLNAQAQASLNALQARAAAQQRLAALLADTFAYAYAPIWMSANTAQEAHEIRASLGGKEVMIARSGSNAPLRFSGALIRRLAKQHPASYRRTSKIHLLSSWLAAVLTGDSNVPIDIGNACGMSLMHYKDRCWDDALINATVDATVAATDTAWAASCASYKLRDKLPPLAEPTALVGNVCAYFVCKYGIHPACTIVAGSGDNPQTKVLAPGDLLSLGTSLVNMVATDGSTLDANGFANAMYDGVGRPFLFACRTNGALVWDKVRLHYGMRADDYAPAEAALTQTCPGQAKFMIWQPRAESLPPSPACDAIRIGYSQPSLGDDYTGVIESSLALVYLSSRDFYTVPRTSTPLYVAGGATQSPQIMRRVAALWNRPVIAIEKGGAALGAALAGAFAYRMQPSQRATSADTAIDALSRAVLRHQQPIQPLPEDIQAYHAHNGYLRLLEARALEYLKPVPQAG